MADMDAVVGKTRQAQETKENKELSTAQCQQHGCQD
jgi:hypothetical protein